MTMDRNSPPNLPPHGEELSSPYLDTSQAAAYVRTSTRTLERLRLVGGGPKYAKAGRKVLYRKDWLDDWIESRTFTSTSEARLRDITFADVIAFFVSA
jgi:hypothetical protein